MRRIFIILLLSAGVLTTYAQRERTTISIQRTPKKSLLKTKTAVITPVFNEDTLHCESSDLNKILHLAGYDKPLTASRESLHVKNLTADTIVNGFNLAISYLDLQGRELHSRDVWVNLSLNPGDTQLVTFPSWDIQRSFYYCRSVKPRRQSTPYEVAFKLKAITLQPH